MNNVSAMIWKHNFQEITLKLILYFGHFKAKSSSSEKCPQFQLALLLGFCKSDYPPTPLLKPCGNATTIGRKQSRFFTG